MTRSAVAPKVHNDAYALSCELCGAMKGEPCFRVTGLPWDASTRVLDEPHGCRVRAYVAALNEESR